MDRDDEQQFQQLKAWWQHNGSSLVMGLALALVVLAGWWGYTNWQERSAQQAAAAYAEFLRAEQQEEGVDSVEQLGERVLEEHGDSGYAALAALRLGHFQAQAGEYRRAAQTLGWLVEHADHRAMAELARLRQARALGEEDPEEALELLKESAPATFRANYAQLRGDLLSELERSEEAVAAYREALERGQDLGGQARELVRLKLRAQEART
ncbi:MAG: YfgM family protein [Halorhodospira sp.]